MIGEIREGYQLSLNRTCRLVSVSKTAHYHQSKKKTDDTEIEFYLKELAQSHKRWGVDKMMLKAKMDRKPWNHKRVHRIYCEIGLNIRIKPRKRIPKGEAKILMQPIQANVCWSIDFMSDALSSGVRFRTLNVIDDYNREALLIEPSYSLPTRRVTHLIDQLAVERGYPEVIRVDNGPEFASSAFKAWAAERRILINYIQPGKPAQNGYIERFNRTYRGDILDMNLFNNLDEVKAITQNWLPVYNEDRPHESLAGLPPVQFARRRQQQLTGKGENSTFN